MRKRYTTISLPEDLIKSAEKLLKKTNYKSVAEYVRDVLREEKIKTRLKSLGYKVK